MLKVSKLLHQANPSLAYSPEWLQDPSAHRQEIGAAWNILYRSLQSSNSHDYRLPTMPPVKQYYGDALKLPPQDNETLEGWVTRISGMQYKPEFVQSFQQQFETAKLIRAAHEKLVTEVLTPEWNVQNDERKRKNEETRRLQDESAQSTLKNIQIIATWDPKDIGVADYNIEGSRSMNPSISMEVFNDKDPEGPAYTLDFDCEIEGTYEDEGIGSYEYWGAPGNDSHYQWSTDNFTITPQLPSQLSSLAQRIEDAVLKVWEPEAPERDYDDRD